MLVLLRWAVCGLAASTQVVVRLAQRKDLVPLASLLHDGFAVRQGGALNWLDAQTAKARLVLEIEQRMTPWDWSRHAQWVAESGGQIVGFAELWAEDAE